MTDVIQYELRVKINKESTCPCILVDVKPILQT